ncbi:MAG: nitroreductase family protein [Alphaproteobacteria bacterium]
MDVLEAINTRRAVRDFTAASPDRETIAELIKAAAQAPSAMDLQPWTFAVIQGAGALERHSAEIKKHLLATLSSSSPLYQYRDRLADPEYNLFYGAPVLVAIFATNGGEQAMEDCCLAAENLMLAAHGKKLGTCWIGLARPWLNLDSTKAALTVPESCVAVAPIIVGVPKSVPRAVPRRAPEIRWN